MSRKLELENSPPPPHELDCLTMSAGALREKYPREYNSWKNMKSRCRKGPWRLHPDFAEFRSFLAVVGPKPSEVHSLDRRDNGNLLYGPGLVWWADARAQANNRSSTRRVNIDGAAQPLTQVARQRGVKPDTVRKRIRRGWAVEDALSNPTLGSKIGSQQWPGHQEPARIAAFEYRYRMRPITLEGETRADFYIRQTQVQIGWKRQFILSNQGMLDYLISGRLPAGETSADMEWRWEKEFGGMDVDALKRAIAADHAYIEAAETLIAEAMALRSTSKWSRPGEVVDEDCSPDDPAELI